MKANSKELPFVSAENFETFTGPPWTFGMLWLIVLEGICILTYNKDHGLVMTISFMAVIACISFLLWGFSLTFFEVSDNFLVVRHAFLKWVRNTYRLTDIKNIELKEPSQLIRGAQAPELRLTTNAGKTHVYSSGILSTDTWKGFSRKLKSLGVGVQDHLNYGDD